VSRHGCDAHLGSAAAACFRWVRTIPPNSRRHFAVVVRHPPAISAPYIGADNSAADSAVAVTVTAHQRQKVRSAPPLLAVWLSAEPGVSCPCGCCCSFSSLLLLLPADITVLQRRCPSRTECMCTPWTNRWSTSAIFSAMLAAVTFARGLMKHRIRTVPGPVDGLDHHPNTGTLSHEVASKRHRSLLPVSKASVPDSDCSGFAARSRRKVQANGTEGRLVVSMRSARTREVVSSAATFRQRLVIHCAQFSCSTGNVHFRWRRLHGVRFRVPARRERELSSCTCLHASTRRRTRSSGKAFSSLGAPERAQEGGRFFAGDTGWLAGWLLGKARHFHRCN